MIFANRIRQAIAETHFVRKVAISIGVATANKKTSIDKLFADADMALYKAKRIKSYAHQL